MSEPEAMSHLADLARWLDSIQSALEGVPLLNVRDADSPGALAVRVAPDPAGIRTSVELIRIAEPTLAVLVSPVPWADDDEASYTLFLRGEDRITIHCVPAPPLDPPDLYAQFGTRPAVSDDERDRIVEGLVEMIRHIIEEDPDWHPGSARYNRSPRLVDAYLQEHPNDDPETVTLMATLVEVDKALTAAQKEQRTKHRAEWARNAESIARELLDGPDCDVLRKNKAARQDILLQYLQGRDSDCATAAVAKAIAGVMDRVNLKVLPWAPPLESPGTSSAGR